jgi:hypothetical protein
MRWLNIEIANLRSPAFVGAEPVERATWLSLLAYCADQENGGVIADCRSWKDRQWQQTCGITQAEAHQECQLWEWVGDSLSVAFFPLEKQAEVQTKRDAGRRGGSVKSEAKTQASRINGAKHNPSTTQAEIEAQPKLEPNGKERNGMESKGMEVGRVTAPQRSNSYLLDEEFWAEMRRHYPDIDVEAESRKMDAWLLARPGRKKTRQFVINWLNKVEPALAPAQPKEIEKW